MKTIQVVQVENIPLCWYSSLYPIKRQFGTLAAELKCRHYKSRRVYQLTKNNRSYIGHTTDINYRLHHHQTDNRVSTFIHFLTKDGIKIEDSTVTIYYIKDGRNTHYLALEAELINRFEPIYNKKGSKKLRGIYDFNFTKVTISEYLNMLPKRILQDSFYRQYRRKKTA